MCPKFLFGRRWNIFSLIQYDRYFMLDVSHGLHSCFWLGGKLVYTHPIP